MDRDPRQDLLGQQSLARMGTLLPQAAHPCARGSSQRTQPVATKPRPGKRPTGKQERETKQRGGKNRNQPLHKEERSVPRKPEQGREHGAEAGTTVGLGSQHIPVQPRATTFHPREAKFSSRPLFHPGGKESDPQPCSGSKGVKDLENIWDPQARATAMSLVLLQGW